MRIVVIVLMNKTMIRMIAIVMINNDDDHNRRPTGSRRPGTRRARRRRLRAPWMITLVLLLLLLLLLLLVVVVVVVVLPLVQFLSLICAKYLSWCRYPQPPPSNDPHAVAQCPPSRCTQSESYRSSICQMSGGTACLTLLEQMEIHHRGVHAEAHAAPITSYTSRTATDSQSFYLTAFLAISIWLFRISKASHLRMALHVVKPNICWYTHTSLSLSLSLSLCIHIYIYTYVCIIVSYNRKKGEY